MDDPLVTVLILTHDHGDLIEFPLRSVLDQTRQDFRSWSSATYPTTTW